MGWLLYAGLRKLARAAQRAPGPGAVRQGAEDMVRCAACGLNLPQSEALAVHGSWACCAEHAARIGPAAR
jgi:uncharacterized protein